MSVFSERFRIALSLRNLKQSQLSQKTGIDAGSISCYLSGRYEPKGDKLLLLAKVLRVSPEWLSGQSNAKMNENNSAPEQPELSEGERELLALFKSVPDEHREMALQVVQGALSALKKK